MAISGDLLSIKNLKNIKIFQFFSFKKFAIIPRNLKLIFFYKRAY